MSIAVSSLKSDFLHILVERGFVQQISDVEELDCLLCNESVSAYIGYDPTAPSLHVGHLMQIMMLYWLQQTGHRPITLMGGGTGMVGDPSFKDKARQLLSPADIRQNIETIQKVFARYITYGAGKNDAVMANNADWLSDINYLEFLRDVGRHFSVNRMLSFESVKQRLEREQSLSFLEFNYMILQAYDFVELNRRFGCRLQMGGSDQWGNIINGIELGHKMGAPQLYAVTTPLLTTASGAKMGKTEGGAVWLNPDQLSIYQFWQFWRNTEDADVASFLKLYTTLPLDEVNRLAMLKGTELNEAKKILATEVTAMLHGRKEAEKTQEAARQLFEEGLLSHELPSIDVAPHMVEQKLGLLNALVMAELASSNSEARRHVKSGAVKINDKVVSDERMMLGAADFSGNQAIKLSVGKKRHVLLRLSS